VFPKSVGVENILKQQEGREEEEDEGRRAQYLAI
jgi:hypothetical protein